MRHARAKGLQELKTRDIGLYASAPKATAGIHKVQTAVTHMKQNIRNRTDDKDKGSSYVMLPSIKDPKQMARERKEEKAGSGQFDKKS